MDLDLDRMFYGKQIDRLFEESGRPVVVVFREKHADDQSACLNRDELERVCLTKLWIRYHMGYFCVSPKPRLPPLSKDVVNAMRDGETKKGATDEWAYYVRECARHEDEIEQLKTIEAALRARDGTLAFSVLQSRSDGEYEGFDVEPARKIDDAPAGDLLSVKPDWVD